MTAWARLVREEVGTVMLVIEWDNDWQEWYLEQQNGGGVRLTLEVTPEMASELPELLETEALT